MDKILRSVNDRPGLGHGIVRETLNPSGMNATSGWIYIQYAPLVMLTPPPLA